MGIVSRLCAATSVACALATPCFAASEVSFASTYTHHDYSVCPARTSPEPGVIEVHVCKGLAGKPIVWTSEPDASSLNFGAPAIGESLGLGSFFEPQSVVEWRGPMVGGAVKPVAAIVRYNTGRSVGRLTTDRLVVYRLTNGARSCIMSVVGGADMNVIARQIVDRDAAGFVCGKSARIAL